MKTQTKYAYQKRIKELEAEKYALSLKDYNQRALLKEIFDGAISVVKSNSNLSPAWVLEKFKRFIV